MSSSTREPQTLMQTVRDRGYVVLDGGLATTLEAGGADLNDPLWSARVLLEEPQRVAEVHRAFVEAGADVITTATYQATFEGLARRGLTEGEAADSMGLAVELAHRAADRPSPEGKSRVWVAASIGPYGAFLADGSEYRGAYGLDESELRDFHEKRFRLLSRSRADLLAFETVPDAREAATLLALLEGEPNREAWLSFTLRDESHLSDGTPLAELLPELRGRFPVGWERLVGVGANCVPPSRLEAALAVFARVSKKPIVAYPNSGESYAVGDAGQSRGWSGAQEEWISRVRSWLEAGPMLIGGCCRTTPDDIRRISDRLKRSRRD